MDIIIGSNSMIGKQLSELLPNAIKIDGKYDLTEYIFFFNKIWEDEVLDLYPSPKIDTVYIMSGYNGGISFNLKYPADIFEKTIKIGMNALTFCKEIEANKIVYPIASCAYPDTGNIFLKENDFWQGKSNDSVECHGLAKRAVYSYCRQLNKQYGMKIICPILTNCYGPGDRFDVERTKVVGAAVKKIVDAKINNNSSVTFFGDGSPRREIMHCRDAANCLIKITESYDDYQNPINIGSDQEITIKDLVSIIKDIVDYRGEIIWDTSKPNGQMRKKLDTTKMKRYVNHEMTVLISGLKETIKYYENTGRFLNR